MFSFIIVPISQNILRGESFNFSFVGFYFTSGAIAATHFKCVFFFILKKNINQLAYTQNIQTHLWSNPEKKTRGKHKEREKYKWDKVMLKIIVQRTS